MDVSPTSVDISVSPLVSFADALYTYRLLDIFFSSHNLLSELDVASVSALYHQVKSTLIAMHFEAVRPRRMTFKDVLGLGLCHYSIYSNS